MAVSQNGRQDFRMIVSRTRGEAVCSLAGDQQTLLSDVAQQTHRPDTYCGLSQQLRRPITPTFATRWSDVQKLRNQPLDLPCIVRQSGQLNNRSRVV